jgi:hypothetical protein
MAEPELNMPDANPPNTDAQVADKPRRGRPPKSQPAEGASEAAQPYTETVTYLPGKEDPPETKWGSITFHANVPKEINAHAEGTPHERAMHAIIERARSNKFFHVGEFDAAKAVAVREKVTPPKTSEQYRAWVVGWLPGVSSVGELDHKWMSEEGLRIACEVGADDIDFLNTLIAPKRHELSKRDVPG